MRIRTAARRSPGDVARGGEAVEPRHLDVEDREVRAEAADELDGLVAAAGLAHDLVALFLEELLEVEADDRLVLGDDDARGAFGGTGFHSAILSGSAELGGHAVEQVILLA